MIMHNNPFIEPLKLEINGVKISAPVKELGLNWNLSTITSLNYPIRKGIAYLRFVPQQAKKGYDSGAPSPIASTSGYKLNINDLIGDPSNPPIYIQEFELENGNLNLKRFSEIKEYNHSLWSAKEEKKVTWFYLGLIDVESDQIKEVLEYLLKSYPPRIAP